MNVRWWKLRNWWKHRGAPKDADVTISAVVHRNNGKTEELGVVSRGKAKFSPNVK
jgi:hypothetical protein